MTLTKRYSLVLGVSALVLLAACFLSTYRSWSQVAWDAEGGAVARLLEWTLYEACGAVTSAALYIVGLTFVVGLFSSIRESGPLPLAPSLLVLSVGALITLAEMVTVYEVVTTNEVSPMLVVEGGAWALLPLVVSLAFSAVLFGIVAYKARRAS